MPPAIFVRSDYTPNQLEALAGEVSNRAQARRLRAIAAVLRGANRREAAEIGGMQRQTLRDWVQRFNAEGPDGLLNRKPSGRPAKLSPRQQRELVDLLLSVAAKKKYNISRWRLADITKVVKKRFGVELNAISVSRMLRSYGLTYDGNEWRRLDCGEQALSSARQRRPGRCPAEQAAELPIIPIGQGSQVGQMR